MQHNIRYIILYCIIVESGDSKSKKFLFERISLAIQRGSAASIRGTFPDSANYRKFLYYKTKMLCNSIINKSWCLFISLFIYVVRFDIILSLFNTEMKDNRVVVIEISTLLVN
jgi:hypothetical protein